MSDAPPVRNCIEVARAAAGSPLMGWSPVFLSIGSVSTWIYSKGKPPAEEKGATELSWYKLLSMFVFVFLKALALGFYSCC